MAESARLVDDEHENSVEYRTILACFDKVVLAFDQSPSTIADELIAKGLFPPQGPVDGRRLAKLVADKVQLKSSRYRNVMDVLSKHEWLSDIVDILQVTYGKFSDCVYNIEI